MRMHLKYRPVNHGHHELLYGVSDCLGHHLLKISFSSGTFPELYAGGRYITIIPLFNYISAYQELCIEPSEGNVWRIHAMYSPWY